MHEPESTSGRSFSVNLKRNIFRCFDSACRAQGNVLEFWMAYRQLPLYEAAEDLARTLRIDLPTNQQQAPNNQQNKSQKNGGHHPAQPLTLSGISHGGRGEELDFRTDCAEPSR